MAEKKRPTRNMQVSDPIRKNTLACKTWFVVRSQGCDVELTGVYHNYQRSLQSGCDPGHQIIEISRKNCGWWRLVFSLFIQTPMAQWDDENSFFIIVFISSFGFEMIMMIAMLDLSQMGLDTEKLVKVVPLWWRRLFGSPPIVLLMIRNGYCTSTFVLVKSLRYFDRLNEYSKSVSICRHV